MAIKVVATKNKRVNLKESSVNTIEQKAIKIAKEKADNPILINIIHTPSFKGNGDTFKYFFRDGDKTLVIWLSEKGDVISVDLKESKLINKKRNLKEAPDEFGIETDDELEAEYKNKLSKAQADRQKAIKDKEEKERLLAKEKEEINTFLNSIKEQIKEQTDILLDLIENKKIYSLRSWKVEEELEQKLKDAGVKSRASLNTFKFNDYSKTKVFLEIKSVGMIFSLTLAGNVTIEHNENSTYSRSVKETKTVLGFIVSVLESIIEKSIKYTKDETKEALESYRTQQVFSKQLLNEITWMVDTSNPGHWAHGDCYRIFCWRGNVYNFESYNSHAYSTPSPAGFLGTISKFSRLESPKLYYDYNGSVAEKLNAKEWGLIIRDGDIMGGLLTPPTNLKESKEINKQEPKKEKSLVEIHDKLNPALWDENDLKEEVKEKLNGVVNKFVEYVNEDDLKFIVKDIVIVGSNANYNYTKHSDIDLHIITDLSQVEKKEKELRLTTYNAYRALFNSKYDIKIKGFDVEIYVEEGKTETSSDGIYSLIDGWIKEPSQTTVDTDDIPNEEVEEKMNVLEDEYFTIAENPTVDKVETLIDKLYDGRKKSLAKEGEFGVDNLVFKQFRNLGFLDNLKELKNELEGKELSLEGLEENITPTKETKQLKFEEKAKEVVDYLYENYSDLMDSLATASKGSVVSPTKVTECLFIKQKMKLPKMKKYLNSIGAKEGSFTTKGEPYVGSSGEYSVSIFRPETNSITGIKPLIESIYNKLKKEMNGTIVFGYFDGNPEISIVVNSEKDALGIAKVFNQETIWDFGKAETDPEGYGKSRGTPNPHFDNAKTLNIDDYKNFLQGEK